MTLHTITLARPQVLPQNTDCDCCAGHIVEALRGRAGVATARLDAAALVLEVDAQVVGDVEAEQLIREAGASVAQRYDHPVFAVEGMDCADCAKTLELGVARLQGVHYAIVNFAVAKLRLEYDREQTSSEAITALARRLGYTLRLPDQAGTHATQFVCSVEGMCRAAEAGPIELALRGLPGVQHVAADPALARLSVHYDPQSLNTDRIVAQVEQLGFRVNADEGRKTKGEDGDRSSFVVRLATLVRQRPRDGLTALCGMLIVLAWAGELLGAPAGAHVGLYVLATLAGGVLVARNGLATLHATRTLDINLLMTIAALGALLIGEYAEMERRHPVFTVADTIIWLSEDVDRNSTTRKLRVVKVRGRSPMPGLHTFRLTCSSVRRGPIPRAASSAASTEVILRSSSFKSALPFPSCRSSIPTGWWSWISAKKSRTSAHQ